MSETVELFKAAGDHKKRLRLAFWQECQGCKKNRPRACATILLPQQRCRVDGYIDPRPELTDEQYRNA